MCVPWTWLPEACATLITHVCPVCCDLIHVFPFLLSSACRCTLCTDLGSWSCVARQIHISVKLSFSIWVPCLQTFVVTLLWVCNPCTTLEETRRCLKSNLFITSAQLLPLSVNDNVGALILPVLSIFLTISKTVRANKTRYR